MVFKSPGANVISTVDNIPRRSCPSCRPPSRRPSSCRSSLDRTLTIRASVKDVTRTLIISIALVILVVFFFLREVRSTLIPSVSVPLSLMGTFGVMYMLGYTLDNLSLMALTISTGFVVDDAIVVIENISRHLEEGMSPFAAAMKGSREIGFTVLSMSTSLIAVFIPILLMGGIVGRLFREFAVTLSAPSVSLVVSLTTTPMLSAKFLEAAQRDRKGWFYRRRARTSPASPTSTPAACAGCSPPGPHLVVFLSPSSSTSISSSSSPRASSRSRTPAASARPDPRPAGHQLHSP
jgi:multidrug efflux pump subunit AcrB